MSKSFLRGLSIGIILVTTIFTLYLNPYKEEIQDNEQQELSQQAVSAYLMNKELTAITTDEYNQLKQKEKDYIKLETELEQSLAQQIPTTESTKKPEETASYSYTLEIRQGMNSPDVSGKLEESNIIESAEQLEEYLRSMDWESSVQIGTFEVNNNMSIEEIAKIITKKDR